MIYNNTISDIRSNILEPWRMCGEYEDGFDVTVGGGSEEDCMNLLADLESKHEDYEAGEYIGRENFIYD